MKRFTVTAVLVATLLPAASAVAAAPSPSAAMRKGVRDYARSVHAIPSRVHVHCGPLPDLDSKIACSGTFRLTKGGQNSTYTLIRGARVLRISPNALEYRLQAKATHALSGVPRTTGSFGGFLQGA